MNHIHIEINPGAVATFSQEPTKEALEAVKRLIKATEKKLNEPEKRLLFEFEGHKYFKGDTVYWFIKGDYVINNKTLGNVSEEEDSLVSKIFPSEPQCKEALYNHIWDNHKITAKEYIAIFDNRNCKGFNEFKNFYCETIINQQSKWPNQQKLRK